MQQWIADFKSFALRGNVIDLAVAVVIGTAFGKIVTSLVDTIITPSIGLLLGGVDLTGYAINVGGASVRYGAFAQSIVDFLIIAVVIFFAVRIMGKVTRTQEKEASPIREDIAVLREIRDLLQSR